MASGPPVSVFCVQATGRVQAPFPAEKFINLFRSPEVPGFFRKARERRVDPTGSLGRRVEG